MRPVMSCWSALALATATACDLDVEFPWDEPEVARNCEVRGVYYPDADGDGAGDETSVYLGCAAPEGWVAVGGDCDDADPEVVACPDTGAGDTGAPEP